MKRTEGLRLRSPGTGASLGEMAMTPPEEVSQRVARVRSAQQGWASLELADRVRRLRRIREVLVHEGDRVVATIVQETGKPSQEAWLEVAVVVEQLRFLERKTTRLLRERRVGTGVFFWKAAHVLREPLGVVGVISPWNYPFALPMDPVVTALFAGNGVVLKPSEHSPGTGLLMQEILAQAGLPPGLLDVVVGGAEVGEALVRSGVDKLFFTGSTATGRKVMSVAAEGPVPVCMELGGKDPAIVLEDADLVRTARGVVFGAFFNSGQTCLSTERVLVVDSIHDRLLELLEGEVARLRVGGSGPAREVGPMVLPEQLAMVERQVAAAVQAGARLVVGGARLDPASNLYLPTLLADVTPEMEVARSETFGPVLPVLRVRDEEHAIQVANASGYGLFASVWTRDPDRGRKVALRLRAGGVSVNDTLSHYGIAGLPMGGVGESGFGRSRGEAGLHEMTRTRSLLVDRSGLGSEPWWFPYTPRSVRNMAALAQGRARGGVGGAWTAVRLLTGRAPVPAPESPSKEVTP